MASLAAELLLTSWESSAARLEERCRGLTDEEYLWAPVADAWTLHPDPARPGRWTYPYAFAPPPPAPVTSIGWRLVHLVADNEIYWEHAFGPGRRSFADLEVPATAERALALWRTSREPVTHWLAHAHDDDLTALRPSHLGEPRRAGEVARVLLDEQTAHGAEIALLRDLHLRAGSRDGPR
jgi:hypothetical protein